MSRRRNSSGCDQECTERDSLVSGVPNPESSFARLDPREQRPTAEASRTCTSRLPGRSDGSSSGCCAGLCRKCVKWTCALILVCVATFLLALHYRVVIYDRQASSRWWWPWMWSEKIRLAFSSSSEEAWDVWVANERAREQGEENRVSALETVMNNLTSRMRWTESENQALKQQLLSVEDELNQLKNEAYSDSPDATFREEMRNSISNIEAENAARDAAFDRAKHDLNVRLNATDDRERRDYKNGQAALNAQASAQREYVDARNAEMQARVDDRISDVYSTIGDYKETTQVRFDSERDLIYDWIAGTFALLCFLVSLSGVYAHTRALAVPDIQRKILALLWMPPIYSVCCWLSLLYPGSSAGLGMVRDGYEAYTIWVFVSFLISVLGDGKGAVSSLNAVARGDGAVASLSHANGAPVRPNASRGDPPRRSQTTGQREASPVLSETDADTSYSRVVARLEADEHLPNAFCPPCAKASARSFLKQCMIATLQFVVLKPAVSVADYVLAAAAAQNELASSQPLSSTPGPDWIARARAVLFIADNLSVTVAFSGLLKVYHAVAHHLASHNPWPKFCSVKGIVFITYWQGTVIWLMTRYSGSIANKDVAEAVQNFLICVEMFIASVVHSYTFAADEWQPNYIPPTLRISDNLAVGDFLRDLQYVWRSSASNQQRNQHHETRPLLPLYDTLSQTPQKLSQIDTGGNAEVKPPLQLRQHYDPSLYEPRPYDMLHAKEVSMQTSKDTREEFKEGSLQEPADGLALTGDADAAADHADDIGTVDDHADDTGMGDDHADLTGTAADLTDDTGMAHDHVNDTGIAPDHVDCTGMDNDHPDDRGKVGDHADDTGKADDLADDAGSTGGHAHDADSTVEHGDYAQTASIRAGDRGTAPGRADDLDEDAATDHDDAEDIAAGHGNYADAAGDLAEDKHAAFRRADDEDAAADHCDAADSAAGHLDDAETSGGHPQHPDDIRRADLMLQ